MEAALVKRDFSSDELYMLVLQNLRMGSYETARKLSLKVIQKYTQYLEGYYTYYQSLKNCSRTGEAEEVLHRIHDIDVDEDEWKRYTIRRLLRDSRHENDMIEAVLQEAIRIALPSPKLLFQRGLNCFARKSFKEAINWFDEAGRLDKEFLEPRFMIAAAKREMGNIQDAYAYLDNLAYDVSAHAGIAYRILYNKAVCLRILGEYHLCEKLARQAIEYTSESAELLCLLGQVFRETENFDSSVEALKRSIHIDRGFAESYFQLSLLKRELNDVKGALSILLQFEKKGGYIHFGRTCIQKFYCYHSWNDKKRCLQELDKARDFYAFSENMMTHVADLYRLCKKMNKNLECYCKILEKYPDHVF